ncbi:efflux transporter periplasmic adaptor subunit [Tenacibaculum sp. SZ-18]|uniref:efflux RND transporter periplasmic adaptor subunit n=1 Tax=Tenacibaculum sp. SZ-18 TaxID=754423 RepID=UPI000C2D5581|nr:efflux RND transporter periplasmic adaptor subunit [Tenacibaculum sp. SZ-18]AUC15949.1 efflux transporter periplasmic adaptor subunit [Tenacibaculum sp. SZ-18]
MDIQIQKKRFSNQQLATMIGVFLFLVLTIYVLTLPSGKKKLNVKKERISISTITEDVFQENIPVNGIVLPITTIFLDALEGGNVIEKYAEDGEELKKGQPILKLSNTDLELNLINQETSVYNLLTQMQISQNAARQNTINRKNRFTDVESSQIEATRKYKLSKKLFEKGVISRQDFESSQNNYNYQKERLKLAKQVLSEDSIASKLEIDKAKSSYQRTQNALELMRKKVGDLVVRAPIDGQLTSFDTEIGQSINKGTRLGQVDVTTDYKVRISMDEHYISRIYLGQTGTLSLQNKTYTLIIKKVYTQVNNGKFQVDMKFEEEVPTGIRRGQNLQITIALSAQKQALLIPKGSFYQQTNGNWIFKISKDGKHAYKVNTIVGSQNKQFYEVLDGLSAGDQVITSTYNNFKDIEELILQ